MFLRPLAALAASAVLLPSVLAGGPPPSEMQMMQNSAERIQEEATVRDVQTDLFSTDGTATGARSVIIGRRSPRLIRQAPEDCTLIMNRSERRSCFRDQQSALYGVRMDGRAQPRMQMGQTRNLRSYYLPR